MLRVKLLGQIFWIASGWTDIQQGIIFFAFGLLLVRMIHQGAGVFFIVDGHQFTVVFELDSFFLEELLQKMLNFFICMNVLSIDMEFNV